MHVKMEFKLLNARFTPSEHHFDFRSNRAATTRKLCICSAAKVGKNVCGKGDIKKRNDFNHWQSKLIPVCRLRLWLLRLSLSKVLYQFCCSWDTTDENTGWHRTSAVFTYEKLILIIMRVQGINHFVVFGQNEFVQCFCVVRVWVSEWMEYLYLCVEFWWVPIAHCPMPIPIETWLHE